jgi:hypothetical protein
VLNKHCRTCDFQTRCHSLNAEHAVRAFTRLRNVMCSSTAKGTSEYCVLLSLQQTLRCRGVRFLDFLRSGALEIKD